MSCTNPSSSTSSGGSGGNASGGSGSGGGGGPCGACKFLRRKCVAGCVFAAYFDSEQGAAHFAAVHKVFGASNVSKLLLHIPPHRRHDAVVTICYEAQARLRDPVYGCVAHIFALQHQVVNLQTELSYLQAHLATLELPTPPPLPPPPAPSVDLPPPLSISDLPPASTLPATYDLSSLFDPTMRPAWAMSQRQQMDPRHFSSSANLRGATDAPCSSANAAAASAATSSGNLQELARELFHRHGSSSPPASGPSMSNEPR